MRSMSRANAFVFGSGANGGTGSLCAPDAQVPGGSVEQKEDFAQGGCELEGLIGGLRRNPRKFRLAAVRRPR